MNSGMEESLVKILLDTNIIVSALIYKGKPEIIFKLVLDKQIRLVISPILLSELQEILLKKFDFSKRKTIRIDQKIRKVAKIVHPKETINIIRDEDDNRVLEAAIEGNCNYVVTGDKDLLVFKNYKKVEIVTAEEFLSRLKQ